MLNVIFENIIPFFFGASGTGLIYYLLDRQKRKAETEDRINETIRAMYLKFVEDFNGKYEKLTDEYKKLEDHYKELLNEYEKLQHDFKKVIQELKKYNKNAVNG